MVKIDRVALHKELDKFLDGVEARCVNIEDGEEHAFKLVGGGNGCDDDDILTAWTVTTSRSELF